MEINHFNFDKLLEVCTAIGGLKKSIDEVKKGHEDMRQKMLILTKRVNKSESK